MANEGDNPATLAPIKEVAEGLHKHYYNRLVTYFRARRRQDADDLVLKVLFNCARCSTVRAAWPNICETYILRAAKRELITQARSDRHRREEAAGDTIEAYDSRTSAPPDLDHQVIAELIRATGELPELMREALALKYTAGLSESKAAAVLGIPVGTFKTRCFQGLAKLRKIYQAVAGEETSPALGSPKQPQQEATPSAIRPASQIETKPKARKARQNKAASPIIPPKDTPQQTPPAF